METLPPNNTQRWVLRRKAQVVDAIRKGLLSPQEARKRYSLSEEELQSWFTLIDTFGPKGLRTTQTQRYRNERLSNSQV